MSARIIKAWCFASSSDPDKTYETLQYANRTTSCSCPAWTRRRAPDGTRSCRHVRSVHMGMADTECESFVDYDTVQMYGVMNEDGSTQPVEPISIAKQFNKPTTKVKHGTKKNKTTGPSFGEFGGRAIIK